MVPAQDLAVIQHRLPLKTPTSPEHDFFMQISHKSFKFYLINCKKPAQLERGFCT